MIAAIGADWGKLAPVIFLKLFPITDFHTDARWYPHTDDVVGKRHTREEISVWI
jgi:hypothetical protein